MADTNVLSPLVVKEVLMTGMNKTFRNRDVLITEGLFSNALEKFPQDVQLDDAGNYSLRVPYVKEGTSRDMTFGWAIREKQDTGSYSRTMSWNKTFERSFSVKDTERFVVTDFKERIFPSLLADLRRDMNDYAIAQLVGGAGWTLGTPATDPYKNEKPAGTVEGSTIAQQTLADISTRFNIYNVDEANRHVLMQTLNEGKVMSIPGWMNWSGPAQNTNSNPNLGTSHGMTWKRQNQTANWTAGTAAGFLVNQAGGVPLQSIEIPVDTGTGAFKAGDIITFSGSTRQHRVDKFASNIITLAQATKEAIADNATITVAPTGKCDIAFHPDHFLYVSHQLPITDTGNEVSMRMNIPGTGISIRYKQQRGENITGHTVECVCHFLVWDPCGVGRIYYA